MFSYGTFFLSCAWFTEIEQRILYGSTFWLKHGKKIEEI